MQFIFSIFRQTFKCFGYIYSPSSGSTPYRYNWHLLFFLDDCLLSWLGLEFLQFRNPFKDINTSLLQPIFYRCREKKSDTLRMRRAVVTVRGREMGNLKQHVCSTFCRYIFHCPTLSELRLAESQFFHL
jgi:hypothetical protein